MDRTNILFVGHGKIGKAIEDVLRDAPRKKLHIQAWDIDQRRSDASVTLAEAVPAAHIIFLTLPSWAISEASTEMKPYLNPKTILVCVSKGLDQSGETVDELMPRLFPSQPFALCFGPMLADELLDGKTGTATVASHTSSTRKTLVHLFSGTRIRVTPIADVRGTALCGVLKNVYVMGFGIARALDAGSNFHGQYAERSFAEMSRILRTLGGKHSTLEGPAGIGDFIATGFSTTSKNVLYAELVARKKKPAFLSEGRVSIGTLVTRLGARSKEYPILLAINRIIRRKGDPKLLLRA